MYPSTVLAYERVSVFLMVVMFVSWLYSNFFFIPLCMTLGPTKNFGQLTSCGKLHQLPVEEHIDRTDETVG